MAPYDNTDVTWNGLRLAGKLVEGENEVRTFMMNDAVDSIAKKLSRSESPSKLLQAFQGKPIIPHLPI